jgi:hypothetical protein
MQVLNIRRSRQAGVCEIGAEITFDTAREGPFHVWFRMPNEFVSEETVLQGDPFVAAMLPVAMACGEPLRVHGKVSESLFRSTPEIQDLYSRWEPLMSKIDVTADSVVADKAASASSEVGLFFSLGVDSFYSLLHNDEPAQKSITHLFLVRGFDIPLDAQYDRAFEATVAAAQTVANHYSKTLVAMATNLRQVADRFVPWDRIYHGAAMASVALATCGAVRRMYIASSRDSEHLRPWGSHPHLDPLWSTRITRFIHDEYEICRLEKVRYISRSKVALDSLRVCYQNRHGFYNCGRCNKCLLTMVSLQIVGALSRCSTLPNQIDVETIAQSPFWKENIEALNNSAALQDSDLKRAVDRYIARARNAETPNNSWMYQEWLVLKRSVAEEIERLTEPSEIVVVCGQESISHWVTNGARIHSFPEADGVFWGAPADDIAALNYLEQARQNGANYFVVDRECFWWLEHYKGLSEQLARICQRVISKDKLIVYRFLNDAVLL